MSNIDLRKEFITRLELVTPEHKMSRFLNPMILEKKDLNITDQQKSGWVSDGSLVSFVSGVSAASQADILNSTLLAQMAADKKFDRETKIKEWYQFYREVLQNVGWVIQDFTFSKYTATGDDFTADKAVIDILLSIATSNEIAVIVETIKALKALSDNDGRLVLFENTSHTLRNGNFQICVASEVGGVVAMKIGCLYFETEQNVTKVLWFKFSSIETNLHKGSQSITLDQNIYSNVRNDIVQKLGDKAKLFIKNISI